VTSKDVTTALVALERRKMSRGLDSIAHMVASAVIRETADCTTREDYERDMAAAKEVAAAMIPLVRDDVPHDFLRLHGDNPQRFTVVMTSYKLGIGVADEIVRAQKGWQ